MCGSVWIAVLPDCLLTCQILTFCCHVSSNSLCLSARPDTPPSCRRLIRFDTVLPPNAQEWSHDANCSPVIWVAVLRTPISVYDQSDIRKCMQYSTDMSGPQLVVIPGSSPQFSDGITRFLPCSWPLEFWAHSAAPYTVCGPNYTPPEALSAVRLVHPDLWKFLVNNIVSAHEPVNVS